MIETRNATVALSGTEKAVEFAAAYNYFYVKNDSPDTVYVSMSPNITAGADGVVYVREKLSDLTTSAMFSAVSCGTFFNVQLIVVLCPYDGEMILPSYLVKLFADSAGATSML